MALPYAIHLGKAEPRARFALGGEEGLERTLADFRRHADSGVADLDADLAAGRIRPDCQRSAAGHRIERILDEIEQRLTQFTGDAADHDAAPARGPPAMQAPQRCAPRPSSPTARLPSILGRRVRPSVALLPRAVERVAS